jgi:hypothetical protein
MVVPAHVPAGYLAPAVGTRYCYWVLEYTKYVLCRRGKLQTACRGGAPRALEEPPFFSPPFLERVYRGSL